MFNSLWEGLKIAEIVFIKMVYSVIAVSVGLHGSEMVPSNIFPYFYFLYLVKLHISMTTK